MDFGQVRRKITAMELSFPPPNTRTEPNVNLLRAFSPSMANTVRMTNPAAASPGLSSAAATPVLFPAFDYQPLGRVVYGAGALGRLGELVREYGGTRVLLVTDPGLEAAGHPQKALRFMRGAGLEVFMFDGVEENPETGHIVAGV